MSAPGAATAVPGVVALWRPRLLSLLRSAPARSGSPPCSGAGHAFPRLAAFLAEPMPDEFGGLAVASYRPGLGPFCDLWVTVMRLPGRVAAPRPLRLLRGRRERLDSKADGRVPAARRRANRRLRQHALSPLRIRVERPTSASAFRSIPPPRGLPAGGSAGQMSAMPYRVKEVFHTVQGEGLNAGRAAVFVRFSGCNLWDGREEGRPQGPSCSRWCDTDFRGTDGPNGGVYPDAPSLALACLAALNGSPPSLLVLTGGEPMLQLDYALAAELRPRGFTLAVETNGTRPVSAELGLDHVCVSPKAGTRLRQTSGAELKLVWPQEGLAPEQFEQLPFGHFFLQPLDGPRRAEHEALCIEIVKRRPRWRLSVQTHKYLGIP